jgi:hypothetical protein
MMHVPLKWAQGQQGFTVFASALGLVLIAACSSAPLDDADEGQPPSADAGGSSATAGAPSVPSTSGSAPVGEPDYRKQDYPAGPYGIGKGATLENYAFLGWRDPVAAGYDIAQLKPVYLADFYNPDGRSDTRYLWINASAVWCSVCRAEMADIKNNAVNATFKPKGVQLVVTLFEDNESGPATPMDLKRWGEAPTHSIDFPLLLDPGFKLGAFFTSDATPLNLLVDARTMTVVDATMGYSSDYWSQVAALLEKDK